MKWQTIPLQISPAVAVRDDVSKLLDDKIHNVITTTYKISLIISVLWERHYKAQPTEKSVDKLQSDLMDAVLHIIYANASRHVVGNPFQKEFLRRLPF